jgi:isoleucyl-tRNA synthetase
MNPAQVNAISSGKPVKLTVGGSPVEVLPEEVELESRPVEGYSIVEGDGLAVGVTTAIDEELSSEGLARDIVRRIQSLRKEAGFNINDHITTYYTGDSEIVEVFSEEADYIMSETLSDELIEGPPLEGSRSGSYEIGGFQLVLGLVRIH